MPNTDVKLLWDELAKVISMVRRHERTICEQGDQLVRLALERDRVILEMEHIRAENRISGPGWPSTGRPSGPRGDRAAYDTYVRQVL